MSYTLFQLTLVLYTVSGALQDLNQAIELCHGRGKVACQAYTQRGLIKRLEGMYSIGPNRHTCVGPKFM